MRKLPRGGIFVRRVPPIRCFALSALHQALASDALGSDGMGGFCACWDRLENVLDVVHIISFLLLSASSTLGCQIQVHRSMSSPGRSRGLHSLTLCNTRSQGERACATCTNSDFSLRNQSSIALGTGLSDRLVCPKSVSFSHAMSD